MLKNNALKRIIVSTLALFILLFLYLFPVNSNSNNISTSTSYVEVITMPIYLIDTNNYVARTDLLKKSEILEDNINYIIDVLTEDSNESFLLPNNFKAIIPKNTKLIDFSINEKLLKLNFSKEFLSVSAENEEKMYEALIFSLCELNEIDEIIIFIEGNKLNNYIHSDKSLPSTLNKEFGINKVYDITSVKATSKTINYYISKNNDQTYYIPITKYSNSFSEKIEIIIKNLQTSPINQTNLISYLKASANTTDYQILEQSVLLSFNNELIADLSSQNILEEVKYSIFLSVRDTYNVKSVIFDIPSEKKIDVILD